MIQCEGCCTFHACAFAQAVSTKDYYLAAGRKVNSVISGLQFRRTGTPMVPKPALV